MVTGPLRCGLAVLRPRYAELGLPRPLPLEWVLTGVHSGAPGTWGGHPQFTRLDDAGLIPNVDKLRRHLDEVIAVAREIAVNPRSRCS